MSSLVFGTFDVYVGQVGLLYSMYACLSADCNCSVFVLSMCTFFPTYWQLPGVIFCCPELVNPIAGVCWWWKCTACLLDRHCGCWLKGNVVVVSAHGVGQAFVCVCCLLGVSRTVGVQSCSKTGSVVGWFSSSCHERKARVQFLLLVW